MNVWFSRRHGIGSSITFPSIVSFIAARRTALPLFVVRWAVLPHAVLIAATRIAIGKRPYERRRGNT